MIVRPRSANVEPWLADGAEFVPNHAQPPGPWGIKASADLIALSPNDFSKHIRGRNPLHIFHGGISGKFNHRSLLAQRDDAMQDEAALVADENNRPCVYAGRSGRFDMDEVAIPKYRMHGGSAGSEGDRFVGVEQSGDNPGSVEGCSSGLRLRRGHGWVCRGMSHGRICLVKDIP